MGVMKGKRPATIKATTPNLGVEVAYRKALRHLLAEMHSDVLAEVVVLYGQHRPGIAQDANLPVMLQRLFQRLTSSWYRRLNDLGPQVARIFAKGATQHTERAMMQALKKVGFTVSFNMTERSEQAYQAVIGANVGLISNLGVDYFQGVQQAVWQSVQSGHDMGTLSKTLQERFEMSRRRADLIARDQNSKAKAAIEKERRLELGMTRAIWQHSHAGRNPRISHVHADGKEYDIEQGMYIDGKWIQPGEEINCKCTSRALIPGFNA
ncbi:MAG: phage head morphogenesis protein [Moraxellaceae bacterium]|nr:MAG: phage head morphogenesis protein [Moraxellaceae bacterium]